MTIDGTSRTLRDFHLTISDLQIRGQLAIWDINIEIALKRTHDYDWIVPRRTINDYNIRDNAKAPFENYEN